MKCKNCNFEPINWPENYVKGCRPIETETGITHDWNRCNDIKDGNITKSKKWVSYTCLTCNCPVLAHPKWHDGTGICCTCKPQNYRQLTEKEISELGPHAYTSKGKRPNWDKFKNNHDKANM